MARLLDAMCGSCVQVMKTNERCLRWKGRKVEVDNTGREEDEGAREGGKVNRAGAVKRSSIGFLFSHLGISLCFVRSCRLLEGVTIARFTGGCARAHIE